MLFYTRTTRLRAELFSHCKVWGFEPTSLHCSLQANLNVYSQRKPRLSNAMMTSVYLKNKYVARKNMKRSSFSSTRHIVSTPVTRTCSCLIADDSQLHTALVFKESSVLISYNSSENLKFTVALPEEKRKKENPVGVVRQARKVQI